MTKEDPADAHEERNMWNQIVNDLKRLKVIHARATEVSSAIVEMESRFDGSQYLFFDVMTLSYCSYAFVAFVLYVFYDQVKIFGCSNLCSRCMRESITLPELCWLPMF